LTRSFALIAAIAAGLIFAAPAAAGTLTVDHATASSAYVAGPGENNDFSVTALGGIYVIQDHGVAQVPLNELAGSVCAVMEPWKFKCPATSVAALTVDLGDGSDTLDDSSSSLPTVVEAGAGPKTVSTGGGNDRILVQNGVSDRVSCGGGDDTVVADPQDAVAADCEHIGLSQGAGATRSDGSAEATDGSSTSSAVDGGEGVPGTATNVFHTRFGLTLPNELVTMRRPGTVVVHLACDATAVAGCRGEIVLELPACSHAAAPRAKLVAARGHYVAQQRRSGRLQRIGGRKYRLAAGEKVALPVRIMSRGHFMAVQRRRGKRAILKIAERDATGKVLDVQTRVVALKPSNKWSRRHK
jgi:hypothetical protein